MRWKDTLPPLAVTPSLGAAAYRLTQAFHATPATHASIAAAHIRAVRKQIEAEHGITSKPVADWSPDADDQRILWGALPYTAQAGYWADDLAPDYLRIAEAGLRTLWRRGQA